MTKTQSTPRYRVFDSRGIARRMRHSESILIHSQIIRTITAATIRHHVTAMTAWSEYGYVNDTTFSDGVRVVTARRHVAGVENVRTLLIELI